MHTIKTIFSKFLKWYIVNRIVGYIPFWIIRKLYFKLCGLKIGKNSKIDMGCYFMSIRNLHIENNTHINQGCILDARSEIRIGKNVSISHRAMLFSQSHNIQSTDFKTIGGKIYIEDYAWIGPGAILLGGRNDIRIGKGAVVAAGAVVTKNIEPFTVVGGIPARKIGDRIKELEYTILGSGNNCWAYFD